MILKLLISVIFIGAAAQKFSGKVAPNWERWGFSRPVHVCDGRLREVIGVVFCGGRDSN